MRLIVPVAVIIIIWAAVLGIQHSVQPLNTTQLSATIVLTLAVTIQRINGVQRWLATPKTRRERLVEGYAQQTLSDICRDRVITDSLLELRVHIWAVPFWYRKLFPYPVRCVLKRFLPGKRAAKLAWRPALKRMAAIGLQKRAPTGVPFRKGDGLIGVCIANNDRSEILSVNISSDDYRDALGLQSEDDWKAQGVDITHNLSLKQANRLAHVYGQVIAHVVQDSDSGEAIGCVTISVGDPDDPSLQIVTDAEIRRQLANCARTVADSLV